MIDKYGILSTLKIKFCRTVGLYQDGKMFISGANLFVRRESFEQAGRFDEKIFMYKEEADLIKRIKLYSDAKNTKFFKNKKIIHLEGGTENESRQSISQLERLFDTDVYYSDKWNKDVKKIYVHRLRYQKFKLLICKLLFKKNKAQETKKVIDFYINKLEKINTV